MNSYFEQVERQLAGTHDQLTAGPRRRQRLARRGLGGLAALVVALGATGAALAASGVQLPLLSDHSVGGKVLSPSVEVLPLRVEDPAGGAPWGLRVYRTDRGYACVDVGRVVDGQVGGFDRSGSFRELPVGRSACTSASGAATATPADPNRFGLTSDGTWTDAGALPDIREQECLPYDQAAAIRNRIGQLDSQLRKASGTADRARIQRERASAEAQLASTPPRCPTNRLRSVAYGVPGNTDSAYLVVLPYGPLAQLRSRKPCERDQGRLVAAVAGRCPTG